MTEEDNDAKIAQEILAAYEDGCVVARHDEAKALEMANIAQRRWSSLARRTRQKSSTTEDRIADLAKGLALADYDGDMAMVGRLIKDYDYLAERIAKFLL